MISIFLFHRIHPGFNPLWGSMPPEVFNEIIKYISNNYQTVLLESILLNKSIEKLSNKNLAAIVFDDGYRDYLDYALPILNKYNCPSSIYVVADCVEKGLPPWTYMFDYLMIHSKQLRLELNHPSVPFEYKKISWLSTHQRIKQSRKLKTILKNLKDEERREVLKEIEKQLDVKLIENLMLSWEELRYISESGVNIGSHTVSHPMLATIEDEKTLEYELFFSYKIIEEKIGKRPLGISYPNSSYNMKVMSMAEMAGYEFGLAVGQKIYSKQNKFEIPRIDLYDGVLWKIRIMHCNLSFRCNKFLDKI